MWPEWLTPTIIIATITLVFTALTALLGGGFVWKLKDNATKWRNLRFEVYKQKYLVEKTGDFFGGLFHCHDIESFNKTLPLYEKSDNGDKPLSIKKLPQNYLVTGSAGDGKSTLLQKDFICSYKLNKKKCTLFFNVHNLTEIFQNGIESNLKSIFQDIKFKQIYLFIAGIDEIGEKNLDNLSQLITIVRKYCHTLCIKASSRSDFANKYGLKTVLEKNSRQKNISDIEFKEWDKVILLKIADDVIKKTSRNNIIDKNKAQTIRKKIAKNIEDSLGGIIKNPLLLRLYLFIIIKEENFNLDQIPNDGVVKEYDLFNYFIDAFLREIKNCLDKVDIATHAFYAYYQKTKIISDTTNLLEKIPLFKPVANNAVSFVHERFYEFFVAFYYKNALITLTNDIITEKCFNECFNVLSNEYSKAYAAFITDAIRLEKETTRDTISDKLMYLYQYTLLPDNYDKYVRLSGLKETLDDTLKENIINRQACEILFIKDEIVFRLARLQTSQTQNKKIIKVLDFIYKNDDYIQGIEESQKNYWTAIYKRSCAISSSLLGGVDIECDYVKHILSFPPYNTYYKPEYDLVNRSHTLIYYGDERQCELLQFKDRPIHMWNNAKEARLKRLRQNPATIISSKDFSSFDSNQRKLLKAYRFRLFDLATLYCFLNTRKSKIKEYSDVCEVVKRCIVEFEVSSDGENQRCNMMKNIKHAILQMFEGQDYC